MLADRPHGRRLTATERMRLDDLERRLRDDDPALAASLRDGRPAPDTPRWGVIAVAATVAVAIVVLAVLVGGPEGAVPVVVTLLVLLGMWRLIRRRRREGMRS